MRKLLTFSLPRVFQLKSDEIIKKEKSSKTSVFLNIETKLVLAPDQSIVLYKPFILWYESDKS